MPALVEEYDPSELGELLHDYYKELFPHKQFFKWLSYGNDTSYFEKREFSFTLPGDIYVRYQSFSNAKELQNALVGKNPEKIDIGAVFSCNPKEAKKGLVVCKAEERELVFDIDMTDYDEVRTCCKGADVCKRCWQFMAIAAKVLDKALRDDFGFEDLMWVFSGRRGIHCWISDERARKLSVDARCALSEYLELITGGDGKQRKVVLDPKFPLHPSTERALSFIHDFKEPEKSKARQLSAFEKLIVEDQKLFDSHDKLSSFVNIAGTPELKDKVENVFDAIKRNKSGIERWRTLELSLKDYNEKSNKTGICTGLRYLQEVVLQHCYPRLDINVTKGINHLLKAPFCIHPKSGRVCVPIDIANIDKFDPKKVPTIKQIINQLNSYKENVGTDEKLVNAYEKTDLKQSIRLFDKFLDDMAPKYKQARIEKSDANVLDF